MNSKRLIVFISILFVVGAFIAYEGVKSQMNPNRKGEGLGTMKTAEQLQAKLRNFLIGAGKNDPAAHDAFWADDLVYTSAKGQVKTKAEIMQSVREEAAKPPNSNAAKATYDAEDVAVHDFGEFAVLSFRLVAHTDDHGKQETNYYRNTGTFAKRNGDWKVVAWQATKLEGER